MEILLLENFIKNRLFCSQYSLITELKLAQLFIGN